MANLGFALRSSLGLLPSTEKIESTKQKLEDDYNKLKSIEDSEAFKKYQALDSYINSEAFKSKKQAILALNFKDSEEYKKEQKFIKLAKNKSIIQYLKVEASEALNTFKKTEDSLELKEYLSLKEQISSDAHINKKNTLAEALLSEKEKEKEYLKLSKSKNIKKYFQIIESTAFKTYQAINETEKPDRFKELDLWIKSGELKVFKKKIKDDKETIIDYNTTDEYSKEQEYTSLKNDSELKIYFKFAKSKNAQIIKDLENSPILGQYNNLKSYITSNDFKDALQSLDFTTTSEFEAEKRHQVLESSERIKTWNKFQKSKLYVSYINTSKSAELAEYLELKTYIESQEFIDFKQYMTDKDKFSKTEEAAKEQEYKQLKQNEDIKWYLATKNNNQFSQLFEWHLTFEENFNSNKIDSEKWMNAFFWGKMLLNDRYVIAGDKHFFTDNKNIALNGSNLQLITKKEPAKGKVWSPIHGFSEQNFEYTSGMLSTAHSFRQKYGKFEAKIKLDPTFPVYQAFWLKGEKIVPEIDVFKFNYDKKSRMQFAAYTGASDNNQNTNQTIEKLNGSPFTKSAYIYTLEWTPEKITWSINGIPVFNTTQNIPDEPMYLLFSSGINKDPKGENIQSSFEIDWVRCYEKSE